MFVNWYAVLMATLHGGLEVYTDEKRRLAEATARLRDAPPVDDAEQKRIARLTRMLSK